MTGSRTALARAAFQVARNWRMCWSCRITSARTARERYGVFSTGMDTFQGWSLSYLTPGIAAFAFEAARHL